jgi:hypothetical protein
VQTGRQTAYVPICPYQQVRLPGHRQDGGGSRTVGAQWYESDTVLQKMVQNWASSCLDVQFVPALFASLPSKPHTRVLGERTRVGVGTRRGYGYHVGTVPCPTMRAHERILPTQSDIWPHMCTHEPTYVHTHCALPCPGLPLPLSGVSWFALVCLPPLGTPRCPEMSDM